MTARTLTVGGRHLPARPAEHPRSAAARRGRDHHDPRPRPGRAPLRRHDPADPGGDPDLRGPRGRPDLPSEPGLRLAGQRDADRERRRADPARRRHAVRRSVEHLRLAGVRRRGRTLSPDEVRHQVPRLARVQPVEHRPGRGLHRARQHARGTARLLVGAAERLDAHRLRGHHHRRAADHQAAAPPRPGGDVLADAERRARDPRRHGPLHDRELGLRARLRGRLLAGDRLLAGGPDLPVLHDHGPEDGAGRDASVGWSSACSSRWRARS